MALESAFVPLYPFIFGWNVQIQMTDFVQI